MDATRKLHVAYGLLVAVLLAAAGTLYFGYAERGAETERLAAAQRSLLAEHEALKAEARAQREKLAALEGDLKAARDRSVQLATIEADLKSAQARNAELAAQAASLAKGLSETERKAKAAAEARAELSRELQAKEQTLGEAMARSAELNKAYESLLKDKSKLAADSASISPRRRGGRRRMTRVRRSSGSLNGGPAVPVRRSTSKASSGVTTLRKRETTAN